MTAGVMAVLTLAVAIVIVPWDVDVAPWAPLDLPTIAAFTSDQVTAIASYTDSVWLPALLAFLAGPVAAVLVLAIPSWRRWVCSLGPTGRPWLADAATGAVLLLVVRAAALPFWVWVSVVRRDAGLLVSPWSTEILRWTIETVVYVALGAVAAAATMATVRRWPRHGWWAVVAGAVIVAGVVSAVAPFVQRLEGTRADPALTAQVLAVADRLGVQVGQVSVIETGDRSPALNANVSGWGPTRTVTIFDTVAVDASPAEIDALVAHELIHVRENDVVIGTVLAALAAGFVASLGLAAALSSRVRRAIGAQGVADRPVLVLLVTMVLVGSVIGTMLASTVSRQIEARADREAVAATGDPQAYADLMVRLAVTNKSTLEPAQWRYALLFTHPTPLQRLAALPD